MRIFYLDLKTKPVRSTRGNEVHTFSCKDLAIDSSSINVAVDHQSPCEQGIDASSSTSNHAVTATENSYKALTADANEDRAKSKKVETDSSEMRKSLKELMEQNEELKKTECIGALLDETIPPLRKYPWDPALPSLKPVFQDNLTKPSENLTRFYSPGSRKFAKISRESESLEWENTQDIRSFVKWVFWMRANGSRRACKTLHFYRNSRRLVINRLRSMI